MGILDEAIREHLELKRQHGADDSELKLLEDDAFGPPQRPGAGPDAADAVSEAATEFMAQPDLGDDQGGQPEQQPEPSSTRREPIAEIQEAPERVDQEDEEDELGGEAVDGPDAEHDDELLEEDRDEPAEEEQPAGEHQAISMPPASHTTEERHAIADQPTEMFDVEEELAASEAVEPSDEELLAEEIVEPRLGPAEPIAGLDGDDEVNQAEEPESPVEAHGEPEEGEDDFFDEQRLSDELDQALEAPLEPDSEEFAPDSEEFEHSEDIEADSEEFEHEGDEEPEADSEEIEQPVARDRDEDVLEDTPDFLEEAPEDDQLWFEQKPPKDFDFDD
jgi:hypothetical protein